MDTQDWLEVEAETLGTTTEQVKSMLAMAAKIDAAFGRAGAYECMRALAIFDNAMRELAEAMHDILEDMVLFVERATSQALQTYHAAPPQPELRPVSQPWQTPRRCLGSNRWY